MRGTYTINPHASFQRHKAYKGFIALRGMHTDAQLKLIADAIAHPAQFALMGELIQYVVPENLAWGLLREERAYEGKTPGKDIGTDQRP